MPYYFLANTDLVVYKGTTLQTLTTHYSVTGAGSPSGGTVTFVTAPASTDTVVIIRDPALTQLVDYIANDTFPAETHERALDLLTMITQRLSDRVGRSIILPDSIVGVDASLPTPVASSFIGWNANGTALASYAGLANVTVSSAMQPGVQANSTLTAIGLLGGAASGNNSDITRLNNLAAIGGNVTVTTQPSTDISGNIASTAFVANSSQPELFTINANATAAGNLTINTSGPVRVDFRNTNTTSGTPLTAITGSNLSLTAPLGATFGMSANNISNLVPLFLYNNGTPALGLVNPIGFNFDESQLLNTTVLNATSNTAGVVYTTTALNLTPFKQASLIEVNQSAAGNWSGAIRRVTPVGGNVQAGRFQYIQFPAINTTSGVSQDQINIPTWAKKITVGFSGVSTSGTSTVQLQLGNGSIVTSGYLSGCIQAAGGGSVSLATIQQVFLWRCQQRPVRYSGGSVRCFCLTPQRIPGAGQRQSQTAPMTGIMLLLGISL